MDLREVPRISDQNIVRDDFVGSGFVLLGISNKSDGGDGIDGVPLDKVMVTGVEQGGKGELKERAMRNESDERPGLGGKVRGDGCDQDLIKTPPGLGG